MKSPFHSAHILLTFLHTTYYIVVMCLKVCSQNFEKHRVNFAIRSHAILITCSPDNVWFTCWKHSNIYIYSTGTGIVLMVVHILVTHIHVGVVWISIIIWVVLCKRIPCIWLHEGKDCVSVYTICGLTEKTNWNFYYIYTNVCDIVTKADQIQHVYIWIGASQDTKRSLHKYVMRIVQISQY